MLQQILNSMPTKIANQNAKIRVLLKELQQKYYSYHYNIKQISKWHIDKNDKNFCQRDS